MTARTKGVLCILVSAFGFAVMGLCVRLADAHGAALPVFQKSFFITVVCHIATAFACDKHLFCCAVRMFYNGGVHTGLCQETCSKKACGTAADNNSFHLYLVIFRKYPAFREIFHIKGKVWIIERIIF